jgi:hypothetical protein
MIDMAKSTPRNDTCEVQLNHEQDTRRVRQAGDIL